MIGIIIISVTHLLDAVTFKAKEITGIFCQVL